MNIFKRQTKGSVICPGCHRLVGVNEEKCYHCGRPSPGMWGYTSALRRLGQDFGFAQIVIGGCIILYVLTLLVYPADGQSRGLMSFLAPSQTSLLLANDSASLHIAVGYNRPIVALFGPTDPWSVGPYQRDETVIQAPLLNSPKLKNYRAHRDDQSLMAQISVKRVWDKVMEQVQHHVHLCRD